MSAPNRLAVPRRQEVDFLPAAYRQQRARRQGLSQSTLILLVIVGMVGLTHAGLVVLRRQVTAQASQVEPLHAAATKQSAQLAQLQADLQTERALAELNTYLAHPWPRTQILARIVRPLPEAVRLSELRVKRDTATARLTAETLSVGQKQAEDQRLAKAAAPVRELKLLRDRFDKSGTQVTLSGTTADTPALHRYLGALAQDPLFAKVNLEAVENGPGDAQRARFSATIAVRPAYGQPGGPAGGKENTASKDVKTPSYNSVSEAKP